MIAQNALDDYLQTLENQHKFSGVVLITQGDLHLYAGAFGYVSRAWKIPNNLETCFDTASIVYANRNQNHAARPMATL